ncbi:GNAT family N-acetyltransferase [Massilia agri]|uniref:GNAT family N-acetyltransferase n=1 Tax=Massilia agri TaxID=1886785 RepID=A0ABT2AJN7_9BURK|nr:GNAT family N-acetyltransferase [Massilia agri]
MIIRPATLDDLPALFAYLGEQLAENGRDGLLFQPMAPTQAGVPDAMRERFTNGVATPEGQPGWRHVWIALDEDGAIAGHIDLRGRQEATASHRVLLGMGVRHDLRRAGLGTRLVQTALSWAREHPAFEWVDLEVLSQNHKARALYARMGFHETGEVPDRYRIGGEQIGEVSMSFKL